MNNGIKVDLVRGVEIRKHRKSGMQIFMYIDTPGVYLNAFEQEIPENLAKEAGFDVDVLRRKRFAREKISEAMDNIQAELEAAGDQPVVLAERGDYRVMGLGLGRANVVDKDGNVLTPSPLPEDYAKKLLDELVPEVHTPKTEAKSSDNKEKNNGRSAS